MMTESEFNWAEDAGIDEKFAAEVEDIYLMKAGELILAGWTFEYPTPSSENRAMAWYWRRPARRPGSKGMLFRSTNQAYKHIKG